MPIRANELVGRAGKQPDSSARTHEFKLCVVWRAEGRTTAGVPVRDPGSATCTALPCAVLSSRLDARLALRNALPMVAA